MPTTRPIAFWPRMLAWLQTADLDYLSARLLYLCGLPSAEAKAAEAFEKLIKLILALEAKIERDEETTPGQMRNFGHDLRRLSQTLQNRLPTKHGDNRTRYLTKLQEGYRARYPDNWTDERIIEGNLQGLDQQYTFLRNQAAKNFPKEHSQHANQMLGTLAHVYSPLSATIHELGGLTPGEILRRSNDSLNDLEAQPPP